MDMCYSMDGLLKHYTLGRKPQITDSILLITFIWYIQKGQIYKKKWLSGAVLCAWVCWGGVLTVYTFAGSYWGDENMLKVIYSDVAQLDRFTKTLLNLHFLKNLW